MIVEKDTTSTNSVVCYTNFPHRVLNLLRHMLATCLKFAFTEEDKRRIVTKILLQIRKITHWRRLLLFWESKINEFFSFLICFWNATKDSRILLLTRGDINFTALLRWNSPGFPDIYNIYILITLQPRSKVTRQGLRVPGVIWLG